MDWDARDREILTSIATTGVGLGDDKRAAQMHAEGLFEFDCWKQPHLTIKGIIVLSGDPKLIGDL